MIDSLSVLTLKLAHKTYWFKSCLNDNKLK